MDKRLTRQQAIRAKCLDCCCGSQNEVKLCSIKSCALWRFRMGKELKDELYQQSISNKKNDSMLP